LAWVVIGTRVLEPLLGPSAHPSSVITAAIWPVDAVSNELYPEQAFPSKYVAGLAADLRRYVAPRRVWRISPRGPRIRVTIASGCPESVGKALDVANPAGGSAMRLVPTGPQLGLICRYRPSQPAYSTSPDDLYRTTVLDQGDARRLATVIDEISTAPPPEVAFFCPADFGSSTIIVLGYRSHPDADLWFDDEGCQSLDNGRIEAFAGDNPSFSTTFDSTLDALSPATTATP
jgi:hypothetical protein